MADYKAQAVQQYDPAYNAKRQALMNSVAQQSLNLDQQKTGVNQAYDTRVNNQNLNNVKARNNISNVALGRGFSHGTIVGSNLGEADQINNRLVGEINAARQGDLTNIDQQKTLINNNMQGTLAQMAGDRESELMSIARQLEDRDRSYGIQNQQLALQRAAQEIQRQNAAADNAYKNNMYNLELQKFNQQKQGNSEMSDFVANNAMKVDDIWHNNSLSPAQKKAAMADIVNSYGNINNKDYQAISNYASKYYEQLKDADKYNNSYYSGWERYH